MFVMFAVGARTVKCFILLNIISFQKQPRDLTISGNEVIKFGPCLEAPYLWLVTYTQLTLSD